MWGRFEQEVLGGPVAVTAGAPTVVEAVPVALAVPMVRPIIGTNTYQRVHTAFEYIQKSVTVIFLIRFLANCLVKLLYYMLSVITYF